MPTFHRRFRLHKHADRPFHRHPALRAAAALSIAASLPIDSSHATGSQWYPLCGSCHGEHAEGLDTLDAPRLQGLSASYLARQLDNFRRGRRGTNPHDTAGQQMVSMAQILPDEAAVRDVARFASELTPAASGGNPANPAAPLPQLFAQCVPCHGASAEGNEILGSPQLAGQRAAYLLRQFRNFRAGIRGADSADTTGGQMMGVARTVPDDAELVKLMQLLEALPAPPASANP